MTATAGRRLIELADQRFVGSANFRPNQQTFDAARVQWGDPRRVFTDVPYAWSIRTVNGFDGSGARPQAMGGDNMFALVGVATPIGTLTSFAYLVDEDALAVQGFGLESQTYGIRDLYAGAGLSWKRPGILMGTALSATWRRSAATGSTSATVPNGTCSAASSAGGPPCRPATLATAPRRSRPIPTSSGWRRTGPSDRITPLRKLDKPRPTQMRHSEIIR